MSSAYRLDETTGARATLGLIALQVDETIERDARHYVPQHDIALHVSRVPSGEDLTPDTIAGMETDLPQAARLLPQAPVYDVVGYGCTSGTTLIGAERVAALVREGCEARAITDPLTAAIAAFRHLKVRSIGLVSPYIDAVAAPVAEAFDAAGIRVVRSVNFGEQVEANVARIATSSVADAAEAVADGTEAVFLSCTNLRTREVIQAVEARTDRPVVSSNAALFWHMSRLAGLGDRVDGVGRLFASAPPR